MQNFFIFNLMLPIVTGSLYKVKVSFWEFVFKFT